jgi:hypothetical protein
MHKKEDEVVTHFHPHTWHFCLIYVLNRFLSVIIICRSFD